MAAQNKRWWVLGPLLVASFVLAVFGDKTPADGAVAVVAPRMQTAQRPDLPGQADRAAPAPDAQVLVPRDQLVKAGQRAPVRDLFSQHSWTPPVPRLKPVVVAEPPPMAPPMPFAYLGKKLEGGVWEVYLGQGDKTFVVRVGSVLEAMYRVDTIAPPQMQLTYLPLGQVQSLTIGETR